MKSRFRHTHKRRRSDYDRTQIPRMHNLSSYSARNLQEPPPRVPSRRYRVSLMSRSLPSGPLTPASRSCLQKAIEYLHRAQQPGGGWVGSWGVCFTYAAQFALGSFPPLERRTRRANILERGANSCSNASGRRLRRSPPKSHTWRFANQMHTNNPHPDSCVCLSRR